MQNIVNEKETLLNSLENVFLENLEKDQNITISLALSLGVVIFFVLFLFIPKIYLSNNIYKESIQIDKLQKEYLSLKNENVILKSKIDKLKYQNGVTH
jgi:cell division protein FtsB